jgi:hypothetical protein
MCLDAALPGYVVRRPSGLYLLQRSYDLRFTVLALLICSLPSNPKSYLRMCGSKSLLKKVPVFWIV